MAKRYKRSRIKRKRTRLSASNAGPILALLSTIVGILGALALIAFVALPRILPLVGIDRMPWQPTPSPSPTMRPTPTPYPLTNVDLIELQHEVVLPSTGFNAYRWFADPYAYGDRLVFVAGQLVGNNIHMDALFSLDMKTNETTKLTAERKNQDYVYPVCNDKWLVYLDGMPGGGGTIRAMQWSTSQTIKVADVYTGQPRLHLDGDTLAWMQRTGSKMDKLYVCDLNTLENVAVETFNNSSYGQSDISLSRGELLYAYLDKDVDETVQGARITSGLYSVSLSTGKSNVFLPGTYAHDPLTNGTYWVWRDGLHGENNALYYSKQGSPPQKIADQIVDYGLSDSFVAYSKNNAQIMVYIFDKKAAFPITPEVERERTQLLNVSNGVVIWMDITSRERDIMKYARVE